MSQEQRPPQRQDKYHPSPDELNQIDSTFTYHPPVGDQPARYGELRAAARGLAIDIVCKCPRSAERTIALRKLEEAVFYANASIARNEKPEAK